MVVVMMVEMATEDHKTRNRMSSLQHCETRCHPQEAEEEEEEREDGVKQRGWREERRVVAE